MKWIGVIILFFSLTAFGQTVKRNKDFKDSVTKVHIGTVKNGTLLVRLRSNQKQLNALLKRGDTIGEYNRAREIRLKQLEIVNAFKVKYSFSKVLFFYSHHSDQVKAKNWKGIILNDSLEAIKFDGAQYLILDPYIATLTGLNVTHNGMSVFDADFKLLEKPFPYYIRKRDGVFFLRRDVFAMVSLLDKNFNWAANKYLE
jgi:hypothetical protein